MILLSGACGYIGGTTYRVLQENGFEVVGLDNFSTSKRDRAPAGLFYEGNISDKKLIREIVYKHKVTSAMHFAGFINVGESCMEPAKYFENNLSEAISFITALNEAGVKRFIFSSTAAIFGEPEYMPIDEEHPKKPINPYGLSKYLFENILDEFDKSYGFKHIALRYFNACGAYGLGEAHNPETHLIPIILQVALGLREKLYINGADYPTQDGTCIRDYIHVFDLAYAHILALQYLEKHNKSEKVNLGNGKGYSVKEVLDACKRVVGHDIESEIRERRAGDPAVLIASNEKAKALLGWQPKLESLDDIIASAYEWHKKVGG